jgi:hypothetical protein
MIESPLPGLGTPARLPPPRILAERALARQGTKTAGFRGIFAAAELLYFKTALLEWMGAAHSSQTKEGKR